MTVSHKHIYKLIAFISVFFFHLGWNKASLSLDASEEHDGYSSAEDPLNSDPEDENIKKLVSHCCKLMTALTSSITGDVLLISTEFFFSFNNVFCLL